MNLILIISDLWNYPIPLRWIFSLLFPVSLLVYYWGWLTLEGVLHGKWKGDLHCATHENLRYECRLFFVKHKKRKPSAKLVYSVHDLKNDNAVLFRGVDYLHDISLGVFRTFSKNSFVMNYGFDNKKRKNIGNGSYDWSYSIQGIVKPKMVVKVTRQNGAEEWSGNLVKEF